MSRAYGRTFERWLYREVHGVEAPRATARRRFGRGPARSWKYRAWVKSLPSAVSGRPGCDPCHTGPHGYGQKASDYSCIPLTREEHDEYDANPAAFEARHGISVQTIVRDLNHAWFAHAKEVK